VFVVHGRDEPFRRRFFDLLRSLGLEPLEWEGLVASTGGTAPYLHDVVRTGISPAHAQAVVVLLTPDDVVSLHPGLHTPLEHDHEVATLLQPRPNVLLELGHALARFRRRTVVVEVGRLRPIADLAGLNVIRFDGSVEVLGKLASRLAAAGCAVDERGTDWRSPERFEGLDTFRRGWPA
jgi:predicted nucleotide-binding protein